MSDARKPGRPGVGQYPVRALRLSDTEYQAMRAKAASKGLTFSEWARRVLCRASRS